MPKTPTDPVDAPRRSVARTRRRTAFRGFAADSLTAELAALPNLPRHALVERWQALYGTTPASHLARQLLVRAIAYRMQEQVLGGLDPATRRRLDQVARDIAAGRALTASRASIKPGTRLLREWQGVIHEVIVLEQSVQFRGESWPSLSAVAREITGARWSGPRFFGLKRRSRERS